MEIMNLSISKSQIWLISKALLMMTTEDQWGELQKEFPDMDQNKAIEDINLLIETLAEASE